MTRSFDYGSNGFRQGGPGLCKVPVALEASRGDGVVDSAATFDRLAPRLQRSLALESVQYGVDDALTKTHGVAGLRAYRLDEFIAVHFAVLQQAQDQQLRYTGHEVGIGIAWHSTISF